MGRTKQQMDTSVKRQMEWATDFLNRGVAEMDADMYAPSAKRPAAYYLFNTASLMSMLFVSNGLMGPITTIIFGGIGLFLAGMMAVDARRCPRSAYVAKCLNLTAIAPIALYGLISWAVGGEPLDGKWVSSPTNKEAKTLGAAEEVSGRIIAGGRLGPAGTDGFRTFYAGGKVPEPKKASNANGFSPRKEKSLVAG